jgi:predicted MFS family arabinose efflux permease
MFKLLFPKNVLNKALRVMLFTNSLILLSGAMLAPIYALFVEKVGGSLLDASILGGVFAVTAGLTTLIAGRYADKIKQNELIVVIGYFTIGIGYLLYTQANSIIFLSLIQILIGFSEAFYSPSFDAIYSKHLQVNEAGREWGAWESMNYFSIAAGSVAGGFIVTLFGFNTLFLVMAGLSFTSSLYIYLLPRRIL